MSFVLILSSVWIYGMNMSARKYLIWCHPMTNDHIFIQFHNIIIIPEKKWKDNNIYNKHWVLFLYIIQIYTTTTEKKTYFLVIMISLCHFPEKDWHHQSEIFVLLLSGNSLASLYFWNFSNLNIVSSFSCSSFL